MGEEGVQVHSLYFVSMYKRNGILDIEYVEYETVLRGIVDILVVYGIMDSAAEMSTSAHDVKRYSPTSWDRNSYMIV